MNRFCQSCGMPMKQDLQHGGTEVDGSRNPDYCSFCYRDGRFIQEHFTAKDMQHFCVVKMAEQGIPKAQAWLLTRGIPRLKRWKRVRD